MGRPRTPKAKATITGRVKRNPARFEGRNEPIVKDPLGDAPSWITDSDKSMALTAWNTIRSEVPWLNNSHRVLVSIAANILGRMIAGQDVGVQAQNLLRQAMGQMGATPADASKAGAMPTDDEKDPADQYF